MSKYKDTYITQTGTQFLDPATPSENLGEVLQIIFDQYPEIKDEMKSLFVKEGISAYGESGAQGVGLFGRLTDYSFVEGVMGLFEGIGSSSKGSTAELAKVLNLPVVLIVDARGKAASLAALIKGFREHDKKLQIAGVVLNNVQTPRHEKILLEVLDQINIKSFGSLPSCKDLYLPARHLGLAPAHEILDLEIKVKKWASIAKDYLDIEGFIKLLSPPKPNKKKIN